MADTLITGTSLVETKTRLDVKPTDTSSEFDFTLTDLTTDGTWRSLDISGIVPEGTQWIILRVWVKDDAADSAIHLNGDGQENGANTVLANTQVANITKAPQHWVKIAPGRLLYYKADNLTWTEIQLKVQGWL